jgi:hypothetical protein
MMPNLHTLLHTLIAELRFAFLYVRYVAQSVRNTDTAKSKDYDAGKKVSGIKRNIMVDTQGFPHAVAVSAAEVTDRKGAFHAMRSLSLTDFYCSTLPFAFDQKK